MGRSDDARRAPAALPQRPDAGHRQRLAVILKGLPLQMDTPMGRGPMLRRFALVIVAVIVIAGAVVVVPAAATAATAYFSQVKTVKVAIAPEYTQTDSDPGSEFPLGKSHTAWCPLGYKVTGGGFDLRDVLWTLMASKPTTNSTGRQGWQVRFDHITGSGEEATAAYVYAQCVR